MSTCSNSRSGLGEDLMPSESVRCEIRPRHQIPSQDVSSGPHADSQRRASSVWLSEALTWSACILSVQRTSTLVATPRRSASSFSQGA